MHLNIWLDVQENTAWTHNVAADQAIKWRTFLGSSTVTVTWGILACGSGPMLS